MRLILRVGVDKAQLGVDIVEGCPRLISVIARVIVGCQGGRRRQGLRVVDPMFIFRLDHRVLEGVGSPFK